MEIKKAKNILVQLKRQVRQREVFEALEIAIEALAWRELDKTTEIEDGLLLDEK